MSGRATAAGALVSAVASVAAAAALAIGLLVLPASSASAVTSTAAAPPAPRPVRSTFLGLHPTYGTPTVTAGSWRLWDSGTQWADLNTGRGEYNWAPLDAVVARGQAQGVNDFLMVLGITPAWAASDPTKTLMWAPNASASPPADFADFDAYVRALAEHNRDVLGGAVTSFQVWNEANLPLFWTGTPEQMAELTARADAILQEIDDTYPVSANHHSVLVAPSVSLRRNVLPTWSSLCTAGTRPDACWFGRYLQALSHESGAGGRGWPVDAYAVHSYPSRDGGPDERVALIQLAKARIAESGSPQKPLWDTEVNYGVRGRSIVGDQAVQYVSRTYLDSLRLGIARVYWYAWGDLPTGLLGIPMTDGSTGARAFAATAAWLRGTTFVGCTSNKGLTSCAFTRPSGATTKAFRIFWSDTTPHRIAVRASASVSHLARAAGAVTRTSTSVTVGTIPVMVS